MKSRFSYLLVAGLMIAVIIWFYPISSKPVRLILLASYALAWGGLLGMAWRHRTTRMLVLILPVLGMVPFLLPGKDHALEELRKDYVTRMVAMEGATYVWGGESPRGIDCSGLPRRAYRDTLLAHGLRKGDGRALRLFLEQWWFDTSAEALSEGYRDFTVSLNQDGLIPSMDYAGILPGDLAVTTNGVHVLIYVGEDQWIQADPGLGEVAILNGRTDSNPWFRSPVAMYRWRELAGD